MKTATTCLKRIAYISTILITGAIGIVTMMLPFIPLGWIFTGIAIFLSYPFFRNGALDNDEPQWFKRLKAKDKNGILKKCKQFVKDFYTWAYGEK